MATSGAVPAGYYDDSDDSEAEFFEDYYRENFDSRGQNPEEAAKQDDGYNEAVFGRRSHHMIGKSASDIFDGFKVDKSTRFRNAVINNDVDAVKRLYGDGFSIDVRGVFEACESGHVDILEFLVAKKAPLVQTESGFTALMDLATSASDEDESVVKCA